MWFVGIIIIALLWQILEEVVKTNRELRGRYKEEEVIGIETKSEDEIVGETFYRETTYKNGRKTVIRIFNGEIYGGTNELESGTITGRAESKPNIHEYPKRF